MLRFDKFTIGWAWKTDMALPARMRQSSAQSIVTPHFTISSEAQSIRLPSSPRQTMTTASSRRIASSLPLRYRLRRQERSSVLIRVETRAGHGGGMP